MLDTVINYSKDHAFNVVLILILSQVIRKVLQTLSNTIVHRSLRIENFKSEFEMIQRENTLNGIIKYVVTIFIWIVVALLLLAELDINIAPLLASAGIIGVALGFGAQSVVRDFLAGMFILAENQYRIGDVVRLTAGGTVTGAVEKISLRQTVLRDLDGQVHYVPNGTIEIASNMTMEHSNVNLDIRVGYDSDIDKVEKIVNEVGEKLAKDPEWIMQIQKAPKFLRLNDFGESAIEIKITGRTEPLKQWAVTGELRKRLKVAFDKNDITIPYPQRVIHQVKESKSKN